MNHQKPENLTPEKCSQCSGGFFCFTNWQGYRQPLCLRCWSLFQDKVVNMQEQNMRVSNQLVAEMEWCAGLPSGSMPRFPSPPLKYKTMIGDLVLNNIKIERSAIGAIVTGSVAGNLQNIDASLTIFNEDSTLKEFQKVIKDLSEVIVNAQDATQEQKETVIEWLSVLTEQARVKKDGRKLSVIRAAMKEITEMANVITSIQTIWNAGAPVILQIFS